MEGTRCPASDVLVVLLMELNDFVNRFCRFLVDFLPTEMKTLDYVKYGG